MKRLYRLFLVYPDGSIHPGGVYRTREKLELTMRAIARKPGVRYRCEEWTVKEPAAECSDPFNYKVADFEL